MPVSIQPTLIHNMDLNEGGGKGEGGGEREVYPIHDMHIAVLTLWGTNSSYPRQLAEPQQAMETRAVVGKASYTHLD